MHDTGFCHQSQKGLQKFSKLFQPETVIRDDEYLLYCRRNNNVGYDILHLLYDGQLY